MYTYFTNLPFSVRPSEGWLGLQHLRHYSLPCSITTTVVLNSDVRLCLWAPGPLVSAFSRSLCLLTAVTTTWFAEIVLILVFDKNLDSSLVTYRQIVSLLPLLLPLPLLAPFSGHSALAFHFACEKRRCLWT